MIQWLLGWPLLLAFIVGVSVAWFAIRVLLGVVTMLVSRFVFGADWNTSIFSGVIVYFLVQLVAEFLDLFDWSSRKKRQKKPD